MSFVSLDKFKFVPQMFWECSAQGDLPESSLPDSWRLVSFVSRPICVAIVPVGNIKNPRQVRSIVRSTTGAYLHRRSSKVLREFRIAKWKEILTRQLVSQKVKTLEVRQMPNLRRNRACRRVLKKVGPDCHIGRSTPGAYSSGFLKCSRSVLL